MREYSDELLRERNLFLEYLKKINSFGYLIYVPEHFKDTYRFNSAYAVTKDGKAFLYIEFDHVLTNCIVISSCHIPNSSSGSGFRLTKTPRSLDKLTESEFSFFMRNPIPDFWRNDYLPPMYRDFEHYRKLNDKKLEELKF